MLKFASKEAHIDDQMDRRLHMNAAGYYHGLPGEQSVSLVASLAYGMGIYANWLLPIYCMLTEQEGKIANNSVVITGRKNDGYRSTDARSVSCDMTTSSGS